MLDHHRISSHLRDSGKGISLDPEVAHPRVVQWRKGGIDPLDPVHCTADGLEHIAGNIDALQKMPAAIWL